MWFLPLEPRGAATEQKALLLLRSGAAAASLTRTTRPTRGRREVVTELCCRLFVSVQYKLRSDFFIRVLGLAARTRHGEHSTLASSSSASVLVLVFVLLVRT